MMSTAHGRVLMTTSTFPRWAGDSVPSFVWHLAQDLRELGWRVDILAPHAPGAAHAETMAGIKVERYRYAWPECLETVCYGGGALINLRHRPASLAVVPPLVAAQWLAVRRRLLSRRYDLLNSHWILPQGFVGGLAARRSGVPHVLTVHGSDVFALRGAVLGAFKRSAIRSASAVTVNSSATMAEVKKLVPHPAHLQRIPMGVPTDRAVQHGRAQALRSQFRHGKGPLVAFAGRIVREKGVAEFIQTVGELTKSLPDVTGLVIGDGQDRRDMQSLVAELDLSHRIHFAGWVPAEAMLDYLGAADVFIAPSWFEAQGLTCIEAMLARVPVVATRAGGIVDAVQHEQTGLLVPKPRARDLARAVERIIGGPALAEHLRHEALKFARENFSRGATAQAFSDLFWDCLKLRGHSGAVSFPVPGPDLGVSAARASAGASERPSLRPMR